MTIPGAGPTGGGKMTLKDRLDTAKVLVIISVFAGIQELISSGDQLEIEFDPPFTDPRATQPREIPEGQPSTLESIDEGSPSGTFNASPNYTHLADLEGITSQMGNADLNGPRHPGSKVIRTRDARHNSETYFGQGK